MHEQTMNALQHFRNSAYKQYETLYHELENNQFPTTLLITCSDSRIVPELMLDIKPGDMFTIRNIANTVPPIKDSHLDLTTISAIEYAVEVLTVEEIIICGHSNCGGCAAALHAEESLAKLPYTQHYLKPLEHVRNKIKDYDAYNQSEQLLMEKLNDIEQMKHLTDYSFITNRMDQGLLEIEGWHYDIGTGDVTKYYEETDEFIDFLDLT